MLRRRFRRQNINSDAVIDPYQIVLSTAAASEQLTFKAVQLLGARSDDLAAGWPIEGDHRAGPMNAERGSLTRGLSGARARRAILRIAVSAAQVKR